MGRNSDRKICGGPLAGLRVMDLADEKADFCSKLLGDLGATVRRVEHSGDRAAIGQAPMQRDASCPVGSLSHVYHNTGKIGISLNLHLPADRGVLRGLIENTDVLVESFAPGYLDALGLGYESLRTVNQGLIMASVTGFGQNGPHRDLPSCDLVAAAVGGEMSVCGAPDLPPLKLFGEQSHLLASLFAAVGIAMALGGSRLSGRGRHIDISLQESVVSALDHVMVRYFHDGDIAQRVAGRHWDNLFHILPCKDGFIHLTLLQRWDTLVDWLDADGMAGDLKDDRWQDDTYRTTHVDHVLEVLKRWTGTYATVDLFHKGQLMGFSWAPVQSPAQVRTCPHLSARGFFKEMEPSGGGRSIRSPGVPYRFDPPFGALLPPRPREADKGAEFSQTPLSFEAARSADTAIQSDHRDRDPQVLDGIRILDFTRVLAGPYATRILGDFGAQVIKVQSKSQAVGVEDNRKAYFSTWNRNKLGISLDLSRPEARDLALRLVEISDVVVENFSPRVMSNWGLEFDALKQVKGDIIMARMSAMGQTGPWKDYTALAPTIQSLSGHTYLTSYPSGDPVGPGFSFADVVAGLYCALAVSAALNFRQATGLGLMIDLSEYEAACTLLGPALMDTAAGGTGGPLRGNGSGPVPASPYNCYPCLGKDRWCAIAVFNDVQWRRLCHIMKTPRWTRNPKFSHFSGRKANEAELDAHLAKWTARFPAREIAEQLQRAHVPAGIVATAEDLARDPQLTGRCFFRNIHHPLRDNLTADRSPIRFVGESRVPWRPSPLLGEHNTFVYRDLLGLSDEIVQRYRTEGIIS